ncbi:ribose-phosphate diphosphokinase [Solimonas terrae]|uniref:Ribose-phosphate diphosphokinase n=1 Tax=Solimonas terrae TaxID=1396819 RepID=A0A6M2BL01_9GAMM|nr:ribose-phosphate diphosphokinase [Solimonas terrae]NGY03208.1 ribose-phosphate diphosphokinase [Solimonas terrae]
MNGTPLIFALPGNAVLARAIAAELHLDSGRLAIRRFADGETSLRVLTPVAGRDIVLAATLAHPDEQMALLQFAAATLREQGARRILLLAPYLAYMRQDLAFEPGTGVLARQYAHWLGTLFDGLITVDPHLHRIRELREIFAIPTRIVDAAPQIADWIAAHLVERPLLIGPDAESGQWLATVAARLDCPFVCLDKSRLGDAEVRQTVRQLATHTDRRAIIVDDIASTAATMIGALKLLQRHDYLDPVCIAVHALFVGDAYHDLIAAGAGRVLSCNTVAHASNVIDLHPQLAEAVARMLHDASEPTVPTAAPAGRQPENA